MLRPQDTATRERKNLDGLWQFALDGGRAGRTGRWFDDALPAAREMAVPASYNDIAVDAAVRDHVGPVWYQRTVWVPRGWTGRRIVLHLESATHRATVWVTARRSCPTRAATRPSRPTSPGTSSRASRPWSPSRSTTR